MARRNCYGIINSFQLEMHTPDNGLLRNSLYYNQNVALKVGTQRIELRAR